MEIVLQNNAAVFLLLSIQQIFLSCLTKLKMLMKLKLGLLCTKSSLDD